MKKIFLLLGCLAISQISLGQSTITIGPGSSVSVGNGSLIQSGYRDGTMLSTGSFNSRSITFDPVATAATSITASSFNANWNASAGASGYKLDISTDPNFGSFVGSYQSSDVGNVTSFNVTSGISGATTYYYRIRAYDIDGITGYSNTIIVITAPAPPVATAAANINESSFNANWGSVTGAASYRLDVSTNSSFTSLVTGWSDVNVGNVTTYSVTTNLSSNTTYYYRVRAASSSGGLSNYSNTITVLVSPLPPSSLAATPITQTSFTANWGASVGATKYYLDVSTTNTFASYVAGYNALDVANVTFYSVSGLIAGTTYYYRVRSSNGAGISTNSTSITELSVVATTATSITQTSFSANWNASSGATNYFLDVSTDANFTSYVNNWQNKSLGNVTSYTVNTDLLPGTTYYFRVRAINGVGDPSSNSNTITVVLIPPNPVTVAAANMTQSAFDAKWNSSLSATGYFLDVATDAAFNNMVTGWSNKSVLDVTSYTVNTNLNSGYVYYYRVRAANAIGTSNHSDVRNVTLIPPDPVATAANNVGPTSFTANWNVSVGATKYYLTVFDGVGIELGSWNNLDIGNNLTKVVDGLSAGTNYSYKVKAENSSGTSGFSNAYSLTTAPSAPTATAGGGATTTSFTANWSAPLDGTSTGYFLDVATDNGFANFVVGYNSRNVNNLLTYSVASNLNPGTTYYYRVRAYNIFGTSSNSTTITYGTKPVSPIEASPTLISSSGFTANWNTVSGATGYELDLSDDNFVSRLTNYDPSLIANGATSSLSISSLNPNKTYYYQVRAKNAYGTGSNSGSVTVLTAPAAPVSAVASSISTTEFTANWGTSAGAKGYYLYVSVDNFANCIPGFDTKDIGNVTSYLVSGLASGTAYKYKVKAYNSGAVSDESASQSVTTTSLSPPVVTAATNVASTSFSANWNPTEGAAKYYLDVATTIGFDGNYVINYENKDVGLVTTYSVSVPDAGSTYYYRVRSVSSADVASANSSIITVRTIPNAPIEVAASEITINSFKANWNSFGGAAGYYLDVATANTFTGSYVSGYENLDVGSVTSFTVVGLTGGSNYYYRIRAYNLSGTSSNSGNISLTTSANTLMIASTATSITGVSFDANWTAYGSATGYYLDVSTTSDFSSLLGSYSNLDVHNVTTYSVTGLTAGTNYFYRVKAYDATYPPVLATSSTINVFTTASIPAIPVTLTANTITQSSFIASWDVSAGATKYYLDVATSNSFTGSFVSGYQNIDIGNNITFTITGLSSGTNYFFRVRSANAGGSSDYSVPLGPTKTKPANPVIGSATSITGTSFTANWSASTGVDNYFLDVATDLSFTSLVHNNIDVGATTSKIINTGLSANTTYYYRVRANNASGLSGNSGTATVLTQFFAVAPNALVPNSFQENNYNARWDVIAGVDGYRIDVSTASNCLSNYIDGFNNKDIGNVTNYTVTGLTGGTIYYYRIRAYIGGRLSDYSNIESGLTKPHAPLAIAATSVVSTSFSANWNLVTGVDDYSLEVSTLSDFSGGVTTYSSLSATPPLTYSVPGLNSSTTYYYRIKANNASGNSTPSNIVTVLTAPAAPTATAATSVTNTSMKVNWNPSTGATGYRLEVSTDPGFGAGNFLLNFDPKDVGNVTNYTVTNLNGSITYYYKVRAYNSGGESGNSNTITTTSAPDPSPAPVAADATAFTQTSFSANWTVVASATGYRLDVATDNGFTQFISGFENLNVNNVLIYSVTGLAAGTTYYYRVRSNNAMGVSSNSTVITALTKPVNPTSTSGTSLAEQSFNANWNSVASATNYYIDVSTNSGFTAILAAYTNAPTTNVTTFSVSGLTGGTTYYYRIRSYNASGSSGDSGPQTVLTVPAAPVALAAGSITQTSFSANWNSSVSATKYFLDVSTDAAFGSFISGYQNLDVGNVTTLSITGLNANTSHFYRVRALNASGVSANSDVIKIIGIPTATAATSITLNSFSANWDQVSGATAYRLDVSDDSNFLSYVAGWQDVNVAGGAVITKLINTGLTSNKRYYFRLRATDGTVTSTNSNSSSLFTAPTTPVATAADTITSSSFWTHWNAATSGATGYKLDVSTDSNFGPGTFVVGFENRDIHNALKSIVKTIEFSDTVVYSGTSYYCRIRAYNSGAESANSNVITLNTKMNAPTIKSPSNVTASSFTAKWNHSTGASKYYVDVATDLNFTSIIPAYTNLDVGNVDSLNVSGLTVNTNYFYRVRAYNLSETTVNSTVVNLVTSPLPPVANKATSINNNGFTVNWTPQGGSSPGYLVDVATDASFANYVAGYQAFGVGGSTNTVITTTMTTGTPYFYRVRAYSSFSESVNSNVICAAKQATEIRFKTIDTTSYKVSFKASASSGKYIVVRGTGSLPVFVPVDGTTYTTSVQGVDKVVYVGTDTLFTEQNILTNTLYYYNIYNYHLSAGSNYYVLDSPLPGSNQIKTGFTPTAIVPTTDATTTTFFPSVGVAVTFNNGTTGTTLNVIKESETPTTGIGLSSTGVNQLEPLSFNIHSTNASPGSYDVVLDFSPLGYSDWSTYKVLKRSDENSQWLDVTQPPINAVITNRATDGIPGKFTISGLSSFSQFVLGRFVNVVVNVPQKITVLYPVGGEKWKAGTIQTIAWNKSGNFAGVKMEYSTDGGVTWTPMLNEILVGLTYYPWKVPSGFNSDKCKIRVSNWDNPNIFDISPVTFSINDPSVPLQKLGDINNDGLITAFDASLVLQYVVGIITFNDAQRIAADVNNDGSIGANDAARILIYTINGTWSLGKTKAVSGQIVTGAIIQKEKSELFIPLKALNLSGVNSIMISLDLKNVLINSIEYENKLSENWIVVSSLHDSKFTIAMVSINEMDNELLGNLSIKFKEAVTKNPIAMLVQLNDEEMVTYEIDLSKEIPTEFSLSQNFPNPFNPTTTIRYQIPKTTYVQLKMFDGLGREVETLVSEEKIAGNYEVKFDGRNHSSGIYFYQLRTDSFTDTKKFVLIK